MAFEHLRKIENDLASGQKKSDERSLIHRVRTPDVADTWTTTPRVPVSPSPTIKKSGNGYRSFFVIAFLFFILGGIVFGVSFFLDPNKISEKNVIVTVDAKNTVDGGETFPVTVTITNKNKVNLELAKLSLVYPMVTGSVDGYSQEKTIGIIEPGQAVEVPFSLELYGVANSSRRLDASLAYRVAGSNILFTSTGSHDVLLRSSPVRLQITTPETSFDRQEITMDVIYASNLKTVSPVSVFHMDYPPGFQFISADPKPTIGSGIWKLGNLRPGEEKKITIRGVLSGILDEGKVFIGTIGSEHVTNDRGFGSIYSIVPVTTTIREPFLAVGMVSGGQKSGDAYIIPAGTDTDIKLAWKNTLQTPVSNVKIHVALSGAALNPKAVFPGNGFFDSSTNTITWTGLQDPQLTQVIAGATGEINFNLQSIIPKLDTVTTVDAAKPFIDMVISVEGLGQNGEELRIANVARERLLVATQANLITSATYTKGPFKNTGTIPPTVEQETTYTVIWKVTNTTSVLDQAKIAMTLPPWAIWKSAISPQSANNSVAYNAVNRSVTWNIGPVPARTGYTTEPYQVNFQIGVKPSANQRGSVIDITGAATLSGRDIDTGSLVTVVRSPVTTRLSGEKDIRGEVQ